MWRRLGLSYVVYVTSAVNLVSECIFPLAGNLILSHTIINHRHKGCYDAEAHRVLQLAFFIYEKMNEDVSRGAGPAGRCKTTAWVDWTCRVN